MTLLFAACGADRAPEAACVAGEVRSLRQPLYGGVEQAAAVSLTAAARAAIGEVLARPNERRLLCTGTKISREWVLTAAHCRYASQPVFQAGQLASRPARPQLSREAIVHPELDLMLLRIDDDVEVEPIPVSRAEVGDAWVGTLAQLSGFGIQNDGEVGELRFAAERIVRAGSDGLIVDGVGESGACEGDSGGPLLIRGRDGKAMLAGVLTGGSASCRGRDKYLPIAQVLPWIDSVTGGSDYEPESVSCDAVPAEGFCERGEAVWCSAGHVTSERCGQGHVCGWNSAVAGFRCVAEVDDPCDGIDAFGDCDEDRALRCVRGALTVVDCGACAQTCRRDQSSARVVCAAPVGSTSQ